MAKQLIDIGTGPNTKDGDTIRLAFTKVNSNFTEVYDSLTTLGGGTSGGTLNISILGNVYAQDSTLVFNADTGKINAAAMPSLVPLRYEFRANFLSNGNLNNLQDLPEGWTYTKGGNIATITHTVSRDPSMISYWGYSVSSGLRLRFPTAGYQAGIDTNIITLNLNSAVTGADNSQYAKVVVLF